eukprot:c32601_g1_i1.p2 GENE.c32601_g1_i1~~c32601_g1_i1.p2  ORF type:complete len:315 (+),score=86.68 c32601_g1_i1:47-946(+)
MAKAPAASIPQFNDFSEKIEDLLDTGDKVKFYKFGIRRLQVVNKASKDVSFTTEGEQTEDGKISGSVKAKMACKPIGLALEEKWNTKNALELKATVKDQGVVGLSEELKVKFDEKAKEGPLSGSLQGAFANETFSGALKLVSNGSRTVVDKVEVSGAAGAEGFLVGAGAKFVTATSAVEDVDVKVGYRGAGFAANVIVASMFSKYRFEALFNVSDKVATALQMSLQDAAFPSIMIGSTYAPNADTLIRARVSTDGKVAGVYEQKLNAAVKATFVGQIDAAQGFASGKMGSFGVGLEFDA